MYSEFARKPERLTMKLSNLVELVGRKTIPAHVKDLTFEMMVNDAEGEDVEVYLRLALALAYLIFSNRFHTSKSASGDQII